MPEPLGKTSARRAGARHLRVLPAALAGLALMAAPGMPPCATAASPAPAAAAMACRVVVAHDFGASDDDGRRPVGGLAAGADGEWIGVTSGGGAYGYGRVFALTPGGRALRVHDFAGPPSDGADPEAPPTPGARGELYGTTDLGGAHGLGAVYRIDARGRATLLHSFRGGAGDGEHPQAPLLAGADGALYGSTRGGGAHASGMLFRIRADGRYQALQSFGAGGGLAQPVGALAQDDEGRIYGAAAAGGSQDQGGVFVTRADDPAPRTLLDFGRVGDCRLPLAGVLRARDGRLVGTTYAGGASNAGCVFELDPGFEPGRHRGYRVLYEFPRGDYGAQPLSLPLEWPDGHWLLSSSLGAAHGDGALLWMPRDGGSARVLHTFGRADVSVPEGRLVQAADGRIYGVAPYGGAYDEGGVFAVDACLIQRALATRGLFP